MHSLKKVNSDILLLIILVVRLGLDPFASLNNRHRWQPEDRSILLGETSAYTQTSFHSSYGSHHHIHLKQLEYNEYGEAETLFSRLHFFNSIRSRGESVITCIADFSTVDSIRSNQTNTENDSTNEATQSESYSELTTSEEESNDAQLSPEDRDLIEILWKQDVDLGVRRDAYDSRSSLEVEKLKLTEEANKKDVPEQSNPLEEVDFVPDPFQGLNYTIDSETGEHLIEELLSSTEDIFEKDSDVLKTDIFDNDISSALTRDSYLPHEENDSFCDLNEIFSSEQLEQLLPDDLSVDSDYLSQIEDLEKELERVESLENANEGDELATEMYPSMEDCWSDTTTMLPLLSLGSTHPPTFSPRPMHLYSNFENTSLHFPIVPQSRPSESFLSMLHSSSLDVPPTDEEYHSISAGIGVGSIGCALAESITTLTNDSDPVPSHSIINTVYNSEFPEMLYSNHTAAVPHNEMLITDLLLDENLQLVTLQSEANKEKQTEEQMDTSNDSVTVPSAQLPTVVDYDSESQHFNEPLYNPPNCNDAPYYAFKSGYSDPSESAACGDVKIGFRKFEYELPKPSSASTDFVHYNHSYHMPFASEISDSKYKPIVRDKHRNSSDEDAANKDEKKAKELKIPISIDDIINLAIDEYNERLSKYELTEPQLTLIRDIRRRGKNKVAAQNCRKRKMDQINHLQQDLSVLDSERLQLKSQHSLLLEQKILYEDKYSQLYNLILRNTNSAPPNPLRTMPADRNRLSISNNTDIMISEDDGDLGRGARAKRKFKK